MGREADAAWFRKPADAYDRYVGRYGESLAGALIEALEVPPEWQVLDVGCGPGALAATLARRVGPERVAAVDPSEPFARACGERLPGVDVRVAAADALPFEAASFDATLSQLVVNFLPDAGAGLLEMRRVTRPGGVVAACVWDYAGRMTMLRAFWDAAIAVDADRATPHDEGRHMPYCRPEELEPLWLEAGLREVSTRPLTARAAYEDFEDLWSSFMAGVGPAGAYCTSLSQAEREAVRAEFHWRLGSPSGAFELPARAWMVRGAVDDR